MSNALRAAASGMSAQEKNISVIANNIANMRTSGFKQQVAHFQDLLYENERYAGSPTSQQNTQIPAGLFIGSGVKMVATPRIMTQGDISQTSRTFDLAIRGEGFFRIQMPDGRTAYTRDGGFETDSQGRITTKDGYLVDPGITIPQGATEISIGQTGLVTAITTGSTTPQQLGQLSLARFMNPVGLTSIGDNLYLESAGSGAAQDGTPGADGYGSLQQGYLEGSNVNAVTEMTVMLSAQQAYEMNSKVINLSEQMMKSTINMF